jgi:hypothetical protein
MVPVLFTLNAIAPAATLSCDSATPHSMRVTFTVLRFPSSGGSVV